MGHVVTRPSVRSEAESISRSWCRWYYWIQLSSAGEELSWRFSPTIFRVLEENVKVPVAGKTGLGGLLYG